MPKTKVAVAMSGGVDSSMAAALLKDAGHEVTGVHLKLWDDPSYENNIAGLSETCRFLDIPLHIFDLTAEFNDLVICYFRHEYQRGHTPNPCSVCNKQIKFGKLLRLVEETGAEYLATGHYAKIEATADGYHLIKATDSTKDQSYFLYALGQPELAKIILPLGDLTKAEVKKMAAERGLPVSRNRESHDLCFIPDGDYRAFLGEHLSGQPGEITDTAGKVLGKHHGLTNYTVGQRQGLGLTTRERYYVLKLDTAKNRLVVGTKDGLLSKRLTAANLNWIAGKPPLDTDNITGKIRYRAPEAPLKLVTNGKTATVEFLEPQSAVTPGQAIVFYQGNVVLGGGTIEGNPN